MANVFETKLDAACAALESVLHHAQDAAAGGSAAGAESLVTELAEGARAVNDAAAHAFAQGANGDTLEVVEWLGQHLLPGCADDLLRHKAAVEALPRKPPASTGCTSSQPELTNGRCAGQQRAVYEDATLARMAGCAVPPADLAKASLDDCVGVDEVKDVLYLAVVLPSRVPHWFASAARRPCSSVLMYGPPGTGKTQLAVAIGAAWLRECAGGCDDKMLCIKESEGRQEGSQACAEGGAFFRVSGADLLSKWVGESEKQIRALFEVAKARAPCVVFIDEIDHMCGRREDPGAGGTRGLLSELLVQTNALQELPHDKRVVLIGATNLPWDVDPALLRRFGRHMYVPLPDTNARAELIERFLATDAPFHDVKMDDIAVIAERTALFSGAELVKLLNNSIHCAVKEALRGNRRPSANDAPPTLRLAHVLQLLEAERPVTTAADVERFECYRARTA